MSQVIGYVNGDKKYPFTQSDMSEWEQSILQQKQGLALR